MLMLPQILDDDTWVVLEQSDAEDSDADSHDSNAEGYFAHDYPGGCQGACAAAGQLARFCWHSRVGWLHCWS
jgi:hypothetical protein